MVLEGSMSMQAPSLLKTLLSIAKNFYFLFFIITAGMCLSQYINSVIPNTMYLCPGISIGAAGALVSLLNELIHPFFPVS